MSDPGNDVSDWWRTEIIDMAPGRISFRGFPIEELIGERTFPEMIWLMVRGSLPTPDQASLLECALVAAVDHGPQAPSIAASRMAVTCGLGLNGAMATAVNMLDDVHGGAGEQAVALFQSIAAMANELSLEVAVRETLAEWKSENGKFIPGFGHRFHKPEDPRAPRLLELVDREVAKGTCSGTYAKIGRTVQDVLNKQAGKPVPMNIDGATAVIYAELGFEAPLARGLFCLSRSVGALAHAWEQSQKGERIKGPTPPNYRWTYDGNNPIS